MPCASPSLVKEVTNPRHSDSLCFMTNGFCLHQWRPGHHEIWGLCKYFLVLVPKQPNKAIMCSFYRRGSRGVKEPAYGHRVNKWQIQGFYLSSRWCQTFSGFHVTKPNKFLQAGQRVQERGGVIWESAFEEGKFAVLWVSRSFIRININMTP